MTKGIKYFIIGVFVLLLTLFLVVTLKIDSVVKSNMEKIGSEMTGTVVTVDQVSISPFSGQGTISGFRVANPEGYREEYAMVVNDFFIELDIFSLWSDEINVKAIHITGPALFVEQKLTGNNLRTILRNMNEALADGTPAEAQMFIGHFLMTDGSADLYTEIGGERTARVEMSTVELFDLGRGGGGQAVEQVVVLIADHVMEQALQAATRSGFEQLRDAIEGIFN